MRLGRQARVVPEPGEPICACGCQARPVRRQYAAVQPPVANLERCQKLPRLGVPDLDQTIILPTGDQPAAIAGETRAGRPLVCGDRREAVASGDVPEPDLTIITGCDHGSAVRRKGDRVDLIGGGGDGAQEPAAGHFPEPNGPILAT